MKLFKKSEDFFYSKVINIQSTEMNNAENKPFKLHTATILFKFSDNYAEECIKFVSKQHMSMVCAYATDKAKSNKLKINKEYTKDGTVKKLSKSSVNINYLLVSINTEASIDLLMNIDASNIFMKEIIGVIYDYFDYRSCNILIDDKVLDINKFLSYTDKANPGKETVYIGLEDNKKVEIHCTDIDDMLQIPPVFSSTDIVNMIIITIKYEDSGWYYFNLPELIRYCISDGGERVRNSINKSKIFYDNILKGVYKIEDMVEVVKPYYMRDADFIIGRMEDSDTEGIDNDFIDDIQKADAYSPLINDNNVMIEVDETLSEDDPEYNDIKKEE